MQIAEVSITNKDCSRSFISCNYVIGINQNMKFCTKLKNMVAN